MKNSSCYSSGSELQAQGCSEAIVREIPGDLCKVATKVLCKLKFFKSSFGKGQDVLVRMINVKIETKSMEQQSLGIEDMFPLTLKAVLWGN